MIFVVFIVWLQICNVKAVKQNLFEKQPEPDVQCVPIKECLQVSKLLTAGPLSEASKKFLLSIRCDNGIGGSKVWCKSTTSQNNKDLNQLNQPEYEIEVKCVPIRQCPHIVKLFQTKPVSERTKTYVMSLRCDNGIGGSKVTCTIIKQTPQTQKISEKLEIREALPVTTKPIPLPDPSKSECGVSSNIALEGLTEDSLTAFGDNAYLGELPWMAMIEYRNRNGILEPKCVGSVISERYILTSAHCLKLNSRGLTLESVLLGEYNTKTPEDCVRCSKNCCSEPERYEISSYIPHPSYEENARLGLYQNDIGLIVLVTNVIFTEFIKPVCLPTQYYFMVPQRFPFKVAGWGISENSTTTTDILQRIHLPDLNRTICSKLLNYKVSNNQLCAGDTNHKHTCNGDLGGPLMYTTKEFTSTSETAQVTQVGIVTNSIGNTCESGRPNVYTDVTKYMVWIRDNMIDG